MRPPRSPLRPRAPARLLLLALALSAACGDDRAAAPASACAACSAEQTCVQLFDGTCSWVVMCAEPVSACAAGTCTSSCELAQCNHGDPLGPLRCNAAPCGTELPEAFHCYGP